MKKHMMSEGVSRRNFLKMGAGAAALAGVGALAGCAPQSKTDASAWS